MAWVKNCFRGKDAAVVWKQARRGVCSVPMIRMGAAAVRDPMALRIRIKRLAFQGDRKYIAVRDRQKRAVLPNRYLVRRYEWTPLNGIPRREGPPNGGMQRLEVQSLRNPELVALPRLAGDAP
jgi:hypothetical protein